MKIRVVVMSLFRGSRYRLLRMIQTEDSDRNIESVFELRPIENSPPRGSQTYRIKPGDTFEKIAAKKYKDGNKWYVIADVNPHIFWPLDLEVGEVIYLPPRSYAEIS